MENRTFIDTSAFIALYVKDDEFHQQAALILNKLQEKQTELTTSNFILDEIYTFIRARAGKEKAISFAEFLSGTTDIIKIIRIVAKDEQNAFQYFRSLPGRGVSFTDCTSFALMKRLSIKTAFTFDGDFEKAGFKILR